jgi:hypothetical protein
LLPIAVIVFAAVLTGGSRPSPAKLPCGEQPEVLPVEVAEKLKGDADGNVTTILHSPPAVDRRKLVDNQRRELRRRYPDVDKPTIDRYMLWTTCQTISSEQSLGSSSSKNIQSFTD